MSDKAKLLVEEVAAKPGRVDADKGILHDVLLLGTESRNNVKYPDQTRNDAIPLFEGAKINLSHPAKRDKTALAESVPWDRRFGKAFNVRNTPEGIRGDVKVLKAHPFTKTLLESAQEMPEMFGFSPVMLGVTTPADTDGMETCISIKRVRSVDVVTDPGTTRSLFEEAEAPAAEEEAAQEEAELDPAGKHVEALMLAIQGEVESFLAEQLDASEVGGRVTKHLKHHAKMHHDAKDDEEEEAKEEGAKEEAKEEGKEAEREEEERWALKLNGARTLTEESKPRVNVVKVKSGIKGSTTPTTEQDWAAFLRR